MVTVSTLKLRPGGCNHAKLSPTAPHPLVHDIAATTMAAFLLSLLWLLSSFHSGDEMDGWLGWSMDGRSL
jgi:hypothetical protein